MSGLFVIKKRHQDQYWCCSTEHGAGWNDRRPKQAFSRSELTKEIRRLIDSGTFCDVTIIQLKLETSNEQCETTMSRDMSDSCGRSPGPPRGGMREVRHMADYEQNI